MMALNCEDCDDRCHGSRFFYKCKYYKAISANDVDSSKRRKRSSLKVKSEKKSEKRKRQRTHLDVSTLICKSAMPPPNFHCVRVISIQKTRCFQRLLSNDY